MELMKGRVWTFGANVDTDAILPAQYLNLSDPAELAEHCFEIADPEFTLKAGPGDFIVAGPNFGCGSSREHAPLAIKAKGIGCVIAHGFARIFYRNAFNLGLPVLASPQAAAGSKPGQILEVDLSRGRIRNLGNGETYGFEPTPPDMMAILEAGGLMRYLDARNLG